MLPVMRIDLGLSHSALGFVIFASFFGFTISALLSGFASDRFTDKPILTIGFLILGGAVLLFPLVHSLPFLVMTYFATRIGVGAIDITASSQGTRLFQKNAVISINLLHLAFAVGATISPLVGSRLLENGTDWRRLLTLFAIPCLVFFVFSALSKFAPQAPRPMSELRTEFKSMLLDKKIWIMGGLLAVAIIGEANLVDWIKNYSIEIGGLDTIRSGNVIGLFYLFLMGSRAVSGFLTHRLGPVRFYLLYLLGTIVMFLVAVALPFHGILFACVGWFVAPLFPLVTLIVARVFPKQKGTAIGLVFAIGGLLGTFNSFLLGIMHDIFGTRIGFSLMAVGLFVGIPLALRARRLLPAQLATTK